MFRFAWLLALLVATGCTSTQDRFCSMIDPDSYVLVSLAGCETLQLSFDFEEDMDFSVLDAYAWMPNQAGAPDDSETPGDSRAHAWVIDAVDAELARKGYRLDRDAPDFLVSFEASLDRQSTLSLLFTRADSQRILWQGTAHDRAYPARNPAAEEKRIQTAVGRLLEQFPPQPARDL
jgi:hypothetical protein